MGWVWVCGFPKWKEHPAFDESPKLQSLSDASLHPTPETTRGEYGSQCKVKHKAF
jgi:hypothetical protein